MNYTIMFYLSEASFQDRKDPKKRDAFWASYIHYMKAIKYA